MLLKRDYILIILILFVTKGVFAQLPLQANAGPDFTACPGTTVILGTSNVANGGTPPYFYTWSPATGLNNPSVANPTLTPGNSGNFYLMVNDANDTKAYDTVFVFVPNLNQFQAGKDTVYCAGMASNISLGSANNATATTGYNFSWSPGSGLNNPNAPNPIANPTTSTVYSLTVSYGPCSSITGTVDISIIGLNIYTTFHDTTILEGRTISLYAISPATSYTWSPNYFLQFGNTSKADVSPLVTTTYSVFAINENNGCVGMDTVLVRVTPDDELIFYSAFTPNGDGDNDYFFIGNIFKYPDCVLKVYNRYGQVIFTSAGYKNDWDGSYQGNKVPTGTYFYILESGTDKGNYTGTVTILR